MIPAARISAAIEVLADIEARRRPAADALKDWGLSHRFAGSKDRAAIAGLVYDTLRRKASVGWLMEGEAPRSLVLGMLRLQKQLGIPEIEGLFSGERFAPEPVTAGERERLSTASLDDAPAWVRGDFPEWIETSLSRTFGEDSAAEMQALAQRASLDLRVNTLKTGREEMKEALAHLSPEDTPHSPVGLRIMPPENRRGPAVQTEPEFIRGEIEIQDEGSQLAAFLTAARPGEQVIDLCAGGGGKTLALAAQMNNSGQIYATDSDQRRLAPIHSRLERAGVRNVQVRTPRGGADAVTDLDGHADCVVVDAPCTGTGTWRRNPDAKWRLRPGSLAARIADQATVLDRAARLVKPDGRIIYITCSVLPEENDDGVSSFLERYPDFTPLLGTKVLARAFLMRLEPFMRGTRHGLQMSPLRTGTDGFFISVLERRNRR